MQDTNPSFSRYLILWKHGNGLINLTWLLTGARKTVTRGVNIENADYHGKVGWVENNDMHDELIVF